MRQMRSRAELEEIKGRERKTENDEPWNPLETDPVRIAEAAATRIAVGAENAAAEERVNHLNADAARNKTTTDPILDAMIQARETLEAVGINCEWQDEDDFTGFGLRTNIEYDHETDTHKPMRNQ